MLYFLQNKQTPHYQHHDDSATMFSEKSVEHLWILVLIIHLFTFILSQIIERPFRKRRCKCDDCTICNFQNWYRNSIGVVEYGIGVLFSLTTVGICFYYFALLCKFIAQVLPLSILYIASIGCYDPLFHFALPSWITDQMYVNNFY